MLILNKENFTVFIRCKRLIHAKSFHWDTQHLILSLLSYACYKNIITQVIIDLQNDFIGLQYP